MWLQEDVLLQGKYALSVALVIGMLLETYTEILYEFQKLDQMAVPKFTFL
jgi:hypothetical protein